MQLASWAIEGRGDSMRACGNMAREGVGGPISVAPWGAVYGDSGGLSGCGRLLRAVKGSCDTGSGWIPFAPGRAEL